MRANLKHTTMQEMWTQRVISRRPLLDTIYSATFFFLWRCGPMRALASSFTSFLDHTQRPTTVGRTPLDE